MAETEKPHTAEERLAAYLKANRMRQTPERFAVLAKALALKAPFGVAALAEALKEDGLRLSLSTVYDSMELLCRAEIFRKVFPDAAEARFEPAQACHFHLVCTGCGKVRKLSDPELTKFMSGRKFEAFTPSYFTVSLFGICSSCSRKARRKGDRANETKKKTNLNKL